jgi:hypothetical protein
MFYNQLFVAAQQFKKLVIKANKAHSYDRSCQCSDCIEEELRLKREINKEKLLTKHKKPKHTK